MLIEMTVAMAIGSVFAAITFFRIEINEIHTLYLGISIMIPIMIISFRWGTVPSVFTGIGISLIIYVFSYGFKKDFLLLMPIILPVSSVGLTGLFKQYGRLRLRNLLGGIFAGAFFRFVFTLLISLFSSNVVSLPSYDRTMFIIEANFIQIGAEFIFCMIVMSLLYYIGRDSILAYKR